MANFEEQQQPLEGFVSKPVVKANDFDGEWYGVPIYVRLTIKKHKRV